MGSLPNGIVNLIGCRTHVQSRYSCDAAVVVLEQAAEPLATANGGQLGWSCTRGIREQQQIVLALMVSFVVKVVEIVGYLSMTNCQLGLKCGGF